MEIMGAVEQSPQVTVAGGWTSRYGLGNNQSY